MRLCRCCRKEEAIMAWQPFGPDPDPKGTMSTLGSHYRGFPAIPIGPECLAKWRHCDDMSFLCAGVRYDYIAGRVYPSSHT